MNKLSQTKRGKKLLLPLILIGAALVAVFGLTACGGDSFTEQDVIDSGYTIVAMFDYQGGKAGDSETTKIRLKPNSFVPEPGTGDLKEPVRSGYSFNKFCLAATDDSGELLRDADGNLIPERDWDFARDRVTQDVTLCAVWWENFKLLIHTGDDTKEISVPRTADGGPTSVSESSAGVNGYTILSYYLDANDKVGTNVEFPRTFDFTDEKPVIDVYTDSLEGTYQVVSSAREFANFAFLSATNVYLLTDIDMSEVYATNKYFAFPTTYNGKFYGNGHTITGYDYTHTPSSRTDGTFGMFKILGDGAVISDIKFVNARVYANLSNKFVSEYSVGLLAGTVRAGATLNNIEFESCTLEYKIADGYDTEKVNVDPFVGILSSEVTPVGCDKRDITVTLVTE